MKDYINENPGFESILKSTFKKRDYYFHADEDFREDKEWGKAISSSPANKSDFNKSSDKVPI